MLGLCSAPRAENVNNLASRLPLTSGRVFRHLAFTLRQRSGGKRSCDLALKKQPLLGLKVNQLESRNSHSIDISRTNLKKTFLLLRKQQNLIIGKSLHGGVSPQEETDLCGGLSGEASRQFLCHPSHGRMAGGVNVQQHGIRLKNPCSVFNPLSFLELKNVKATMDTDWGDAFLPKPPSNGIHPEPSAGIDMLV
ncbi:hypothetical protein RRG08_023246 [Elysia crispata]|uniref:Uncharacterized protein n=1 Tax=Elysia crispata TaxID=231223 RepID=A0AAE0ZQY8_9GAST|nr:hypothetical protein RRG08_023246 [Elysia crispata]